MKKRIFLIHGWEGSPDTNFFPWLKNKLLEKGFDVVVPEMPETETPKIDEWVTHLAKLVKNPDEQTFFVGHSIGCQAIMRYLEKISPQKVGGAVFVAGWFNLVNLESKESEKVAAPWLKTQIQLDKVRQSCPKSIAIFSDNDSWVPLSDKDIFKRELGSKIIVMHDQGHFDELDEVPVVLESILKLVNE